MNQDKEGLDLNNLENKLDDALDKETPESLTEFIMKGRNKVNPANDKIYIPDSESMETNKEREDIKQGDLIEWELNGYDPKIKSGRYFARVAMVDNINKHYGVYAIYGQDLIPFDGVLSYYSNDTQNKIQSLQSRIEELEKEVKNASDWFNEYQNVDDFVLKHISEFSMNSGTPSVNTIENIERFTGDFAEWCSDNGWRYGLFEGYENEWHLPCEEGETIFKTTSELIEIWKESK